MVCPNDAQVRQRLETLYRKSPSVPVTVQLFDFFRQIAQALVWVVTRDCTEPRISKFYDIDGKARWHIFDPRSQQRFICLSEYEVRVWLEQHYPD